MNYKYAALTKRGVRRIENQDRVVVGGRLIDEGLHEGVCSKWMMAVVCDGVGGEKRGSEAAMIVGQEFSELRRPDNPALSIFSQIKGANNILRQRIEADQNHENMASTIAGVYLDDVECIAFNVGDTRTYSFDGVELSLISEDHTRAQALTDARLVQDPVELSVNMQKTLIRYIGGDDKAVPSVCIGDWEKSEVLFAICIDGIYRSLGDDGIRDALRVDGGLGEKCLLIYSRAVEAGSGDDASIVLLQRMG